ncbi:MAG: hypothetical protein ACRD3D_13945 [Terriglobia bacterium]
MGDNYNVGVNVGIVRLNSSSTLTSVTIDTLSNSSDVEISDAHTLNVTGNITNSGFVLVGLAVSGGSTLNVGGNLANSGIMNVGSGGGNGTVNVNGTFDDTGGHLLIVGNPTGSQSKMTVMGAAPATASCSAGMGAAGSMWRSRSPAGRSRCPVCGGCGGTPHRARP